jgi:5-methylcytosine-specific restriction endonuclease McrA
VAGYRNDRAYVAKREALKRQAKRTQTPCWICHKPFDFTLEWKHPMAFTADHVKAIANGGSMTGELRPAHRSCNSRRGAEKPVKTFPPVDPGEDW